MSEDGSWLVVPEDADGEVGCLRLGSVLTPAAVEANADSWCLRRPTRYKVYWIDESGEPQERPDRSWERTAIQ